MTKIKAPIYSYKLTHDILKTEKKNNDIFLNILCCWATSFSAHHTISQFEHRRLMMPLNGQEI
jgi:hypothetical protein